LHVSHQKFHPYNLLQYLHIKEHYPVEIGGISVVHRGLTYEIRLEFQGKNLFPDKSEDVDQIARILTSVEKKISKHVVVNGEMNFYQPIQLYYYPFLYILCGSLSILLGGIPGGVTRYRLMREKTMEK